MDKYIFDESNGLGLMNNIQTYAREIVNNELIYA